MTLPAEPRNDQYARDHFPGAIPDTDRIALSAALAELASRYAIEATLWADIDAKRNLERATGLYGALSREALHQLDIEVGYAYLDAGDILMAQVEGARRFLTVIDTPPVVRIPRAPQVFGWRCAGCGARIESTARDELRARVFNHLADCEHS